MQPCRTGAAQSLPPLPYSRQRIPHRVHAFPRLLLRRLDLRVHTVGVSSNLLTVVLLWLPCFAPLRSCSCLFYVGLFALASSAIMVPRTHCEHAVSFKLAERKRPAPDTKILIQRYRQARLTYSFKRASITTRSNFYKRYSYPCH